jgi:hypothetical protein
MELDASKPDNACRVKTVCTITPIDNTLQHMQTGPASAAQVHPQIWPTIVQGGLTVQQEQTGLFCE